MPWCEPCARYLTQSSVDGDGRCPDCGTAVEFTNVHGEKVTPETLNLKSLAGMDDEPLPWHFKVLVGLLCVYLGWRVVQLFA